MFWSIDSCQNRVSPDWYQLTVSRAQVSTHRGQVFFEGIRWQVTSFQMIAGSSLIFLKLIRNMLCLCAAQLKFWFQTDLGRENSASYYRQGRQLLLTLLTTVTRWSRSTSNFYALIGQNLTGEFMRHPESCLLCSLWQLKLTEFLVNLWCFKLSFSTGCTKWNSVAIRSLLLFMASLFIGVLVE